MAELILDEWLDDEGATRQLILAVALDGARLIEGDAASIVPERAVRAVMRRYGRQLDDGIAPDGPALAIDGGMLSRLRFKAMVDADARDYLVWSEPDEPALAALAREVCPGLRYLAAAS